MISAERPVGLAPEPPIVAPVPAAIDELQPPAPPAAEVEPAPEAAAPAHDINGAVAVQAHQAVAVEQAFPVLMPLDPGTAREWFLANRQTIPTAITASGGNLTLHVSGQEPTIVSARDIEGLLSDPAIGDTSPLARAILIADAAHKAGLPPGATRAILGAYARDVDSGGPAATAQAMRTALTSAALAAEVENYVANPKGLARDMKHVGAFTAEASDGLHLKGFINKLRSQRMKQEAVRVHQMALDSALEQFTKAFNTARTNGDYTGAFDSLQRFFQRAERITDTSYWQSRAKTVAQDLAPPERPAAPSDLRLDRPAMGEAQAARTDRLRTLAPQAPRGLAWLGAKIKTPFVAIGQLYDERRGAIAHAARSTRIAELETTLAAAKGKLHEQRTDLRNTRHAANRARLEREIPRLEQTIQDLEARLATLQPGLIGVGAAAATLARLHQDGSIVAHGAVSGQVTTLAIDLEQTIIGAAYTADLNSDSGPGDAYQGMPNVHTQKLSSWADLPDFLLRLRALQLATRDQFGAVKHAILNLTVHGQDWGMMSVADNSGKIKTSSYSSAAWVNLQLAKAGFAPTDVTVVSEACTGAYVYERSRFGIPAELDLNNKLEALNRRNPTKLRSVHDVSGRDREAAVNRSAEHDFRWVGRETGYNIGPSVIHQYVSGVGLSGDILQAEAHRRHQVTGNLYLGGEVMKRHLPVISLNDARHSYLSDETVPALQKGSGVGEELRYDMHTLQDALHRRDDSMAAGRPHLAASRLRQTGEVG